MALVGRKIYFTVRVIALAVLTAALTCVAHAQVPQINQPLVPTSISPESSGFTLTVNGTGFTPTSTVNWNGSRRLTTFISSTKITAQIAASDVDSPGTAAVTVTNSNISSNVAYFEITTATASITLIQADYATGFQPIYLAAGDFNGDGTPDLVSANQGDNSVSVLLNNGDGTFQPAVNYPSGSNFPEAVAVGDFNGDGKLDLAVANFHSSVVSVLIGNGDGTFQTAINYAAGSGGHDIGVGDFNGDGRLDLAVVNYFDGNISVLLGNGDGSFQPPVNYGTGGGASGVVVGDLNGDGNLDLVVTNQSNNTFSVLLGNGNGTFQAAVNQNVGSTPCFPVIGDFNGDGKLDLAVTNIGSGNVTVLLGNGDGTFQAGVSYAISRTPYGITAADFNGDGNLDLAVANNSDGVDLLLGNGDGTFQATVTYAVGNGTNPTSVAARDFNGDGRMDLAVADSAAQRVSVHLQPTPAFGVALLNGGNTFNGNQTVNGNVSATAFVGNGSGLTNVAASSIACLGCIGNTQLGINYAGSTSQGGPALNSVALGGLPPSSFASVGANSFVGDQTINGNVTSTGTAATGAIKIGGGTTIKEYVSITQSLTLPVISPTTCTTFSTAAISGFTPGISDSIALGLPTGLATGLGNGIFLTYQAWETSTASNPTITIQVCNPTSRNYKGGNVGVVRVDVFKH